jgi:hypothetical protein
VRRLYHFPMSPYSRRVRLVLHHKGLEAELIDPRTDPAAMATLRGLYPMCTAPVLVDGDGTALGDSGAIARYLERAYPVTGGGGLWPQAADDVARVTQFMALTDGALGIADAWLFTAVAWLEGLPARAATFATAAQLLWLGWKLPAGLTRWADGHRQRPDVLSL